MFTNGIFYSPAHLLTWIPTGTFILVNPHVNLKYTVNDYYTIITLNDLTAYSLLSLKNKNSREYLK